MNNYFQLSTEQQQMVLSQAANRTGLPVQAGVKPSFEELMKKMAELENTFHNQ